MCNNINSVKVIKCTAGYIYLFCGIVSKGTAVVGKAPAEEAAQQRRQEEPVSLQDRNLFFQTQYLTYGASRQLCRKGYSVTESGAPSARSYGRKSKRGLIFLNSKKVVR